MGTMPALYATFSPMWHPDVVDSLWLGLGIPQTPALLCITLSHYYVSLHAGFAIPEGAFSPPGRDGELHTPVS